MLWLLLALTALALAFEWRYHQLKKQVGEVQLTLPIRGLTFPHVACMLSVYFLFTYGQKILSLPVGAERTGFLTSMAIWLLPLVLNFPVIFRQRWTFHDNGIVTPNQVLLWASITGYTLNQPASELAVQVGGRRFLRIKYSPEQDAQLRACLAHLPQLQTQEA
jgi:hypothetical protein